MQHSAELFYGRADLRGGHRNVLIFQGSGDVHHKQHVEPGCFRLVVVRQKEIQVLQPPVRRREAVIPRFLHNKVVQKGSPIVCGDVGLPKNTLTKAAVTIHFRVPISGAAEIPDRLLEIRVRASRVLEDAVLRFIRFSGFGPGHFRHDLPAEALENALDDSTNTLGGNQVIRIRVIRAENQNAVLNPGPRTVPPLIGIQQQIAALRLTQC